MKLGLGPGQAVLGAAEDHLEAVVDVVLGQAGDAHRGGHAVDQHHVVDAEALLQRGLAVQLGEHRLGVDPGLAFEDQPQARRAVRQVLHVGDAADLAVPGSPP